MSPPAPERRAGAALLTLKSLGQTSFAHDGRVAGYASLFGVADLGGDVVVPGAFRECLARRGAGGVRMLWAHDPAEPIGAWSAMAEDARGLRVEGRIAPTARGREALALLGAGAVDGLSIGFRTELAGTEARTGRRLLRRIDLWEVSLVAFPMLPGARLALADRSRARDFRARAA